MVRSRDAAWPSEARGSGRPGALGSLADTAAGRASRADAGAWRTTHFLARQSVASTGPCCEHDPPDAARVCRSPARHTARARRHRRSCAFFQRFLRQLHESFPLFGFSVLYLIKIAEFLSHGTRCELGIGVQRFMLACVCLERANGMTTDLYLF